MNQNGEPTISDVIEVLNTFSSNVDRRFDAVDVRLEGLESDMAHVKQRLSYVENEVRALGSLMVTKQYLDAKIDELLVVQQKDSLFKRTLVLMLEQSNVLSPEARAKLEALIP